MNDLAPVSGVANPATPQEDTPHNIEAEQQLLGAILRLSKG